MIGIVLVSHSKALANAIRDLVMQMVGPDFPIVVAAGVGDDFAEIGTDAVHIAEVLQPFCAGDGAVVLMDLGSAVLSAQTALELLEAEGCDTVADKIRLVPAPMVEAAVAASVQAQAGAGLDAVAAEAMAALAPKLAQLEDTAGADVPVSPPVGGAGPTLDIETVIENPHGLHARPAAALVQAMAAFQAEMVLRNLTAGRGPGSLRSLTSVALVQARKGDRVRFSLQGADAEIAAERLRQLIASHFGEADLARSGMQDPQTTIVAAPDRPVGASEGLAVGRVLPLSAALPEAPEYEAGTPAEELARLDAALTRVAADLRHPVGLDTKTAAIFAAQALVLEDPAVLEPVRARLRDGAVSAVAAWRRESLAVADAYAALDDPYLKARAADLRDIAGRVTRVLAGDHQPAQIAPDPPAILLTEELLPSEALACQPGAVLGVISRHGSPTAHAAILLRGLGIPMVVGAEHMSVDLAAARSVGLDGASGDIWIDPSPQQAAEIAARQRLLQETRAAHDAASHQPAITIDGQGIEVLGNVGTVADARAVHDNGAEGVGLLRTEFVYMAFQQLPSEDEQTEALAAVLAPLPLDCGPVVVRTPDIGADKPAAYLPTKAELNPFLGVRGIRLSLRHLDFFASNLRAILRAGLGRDLWIMLPMVTIVEEMQESRRLLEQAHEVLQKQGIAHAWPVRLGMMVEVPAAALQAEGFIGCADFFSIGTNDLTQYLLASERGNSDMIRLQDAAHPAVLRVIRDLCAQADAGQCHVSVCGDAASDPVTAALLIGAGVRSLSVRGNQIATLKARIRQWSRADLAALVEQALHLEDGAAVRALVAEVLAG